MPKKRPAADASDDEGANGGSDPVFPQQGDAKRPKIGPVRDTTLQDLPNETLECILIKAVVLEVMEMKLVKSVWKEKADLVIRQLVTVCSHWSSILTTNIFLERVHRILDDTAEKTIRLEILHQAPILLDICTTKQRREILATMKDEMFVLRRPKHQDFAIDVYDRNNVAEVKDVIPLPGIRPLDIGACTVSNCLYVLNGKANCHSVLRIAKDEGHQFSISPLISDIKLADDLPVMSVSAKGNIILLSTPSRFTPAVVLIYDANGLLQHEVILSSSASLRHVYAVVQISNGNLVVASNQDYELRIELREIEPSGKTVRQYTSSFRSCSAVGIADGYGRIVLSNARNEFELLDSEFHLMKFTDPHQLDNRSMAPSKMHYNSDRNEIARICLFMSYATRVLTIFRFTEE